MALLRVHIMKVCSMFPFS